MCKKFTPDELNKMDHKMELILYNSTQPVNGFPHIRSACYDIDFIGGCDIP